MTYKTKVEVRTKGRVYGPGSILPDNISAVDLEFLRKKKFIEPVDAGRTITAADDEDLERDGFEEFDEIGSEELKSPDEIRKFRSKKEVAAYADSLGFDLGDGYENRSLKELCQAVIDYQEEQMAHDDAEME